MREKIKNSARKFKSEFKKQIATGIVAAFAFLIALSWREPIKKSVDALIIKMNLSGQQIYLEYLSAFMITAIAVLVLIIVSRWKSE